MKVAMITDTHFAAREGRAVFHDFFDQFYTNTLFPVLKKMGITTVLHLGDIFDRRKYIDFYSLKRCREYFFDPLKEAGLKMHVLIGNHDIALRNSLDINSPELLLTEYDNVHPISSPQVIDIDGTSFLMMPWVCTDNYERSMEMLKSAKADICLGHFEISGFSMYKGMESHEGFDAKSFDRFDMVFSGHYHHRSSRSNIHYLGNPYEITWQDFNDPRGFHIFDTETRELTFVPNPYTLFARIEYDDSKEVFSDFKSLVGKFVKVVVTQKTDFYKYDLFLDQVVNCGACDVKVMETLNNSVGDEELDESLDIEDTLSLLSHYIQNGDMEGDKKKLELYVKSLYTEALNASV